MFSGTRIRRWRTHARLGCLTVALALEWKRADRRCMLMTSERIDCKEHLRPHLCISLSGICSHRRPSSLWSVDRFSQNQKDTF